MAASEPKCAWDFDAGRLCLDFSNTAEWHASPSPDEHLNSYADLVAWSREAGLVTGSEAQALLEEAERRPSEAKAALTKAVELRELIYRTFSAIGRGCQPKDEDLEALNGWVAQALSRARLVASQGSFTWAWPGGGHSLGRMLWPVARSTADLLTSDELGRVGECADDRGCGWLFLDTSRNRSRQWCNMESCGNRAKARRHYAKKRKSASA